MALGLEPVSNEVDEGGTLLPELFGQCRIVLCFAEQVVASDDEVPMSGPAHGVDESGCGFCYRGRCPILHTEEEAFGDGHVSGKQFIDGQIQ